VEYGIFNQQQTVTFAQKGDAEDGILVSISLNISVKSDVHKHVSLYEKIVRHKGILTSGSLHFPSRSVGPMEGLGALNGGFVVIYRASANAVRRPYAIYIPLNEVVIGRH
jgi:hypothetical protein